MFRRAAPCAAICLGAIAAFLTCSPAHGQSLVEGAAAAAGGSVGGIAGKKVSDGLTNIFEKIDKQTAKAAKTGDTKSALKKSSASADADAPLLEVGPGVPRPDSNVPPPPPIRHAAVHKAAPKTELPAPVIEPPPLPVPAPPPPQMTADDLKGVTTGMQRNDILKLGEPSSRITMMDGGHLLEIYRYQDKDSTLGVVRLTDGAVSTVIR